MRYRARALAKINLHLAVHGRRPDGFHDLTTVFQSVALYDTLTAESGPGPFALVCSAPGVPADRRNLVWRAAEALARRVGRDLAGVRLTLDKAVPVEAGLGGGSADAMAALRVLSAFWGLAIDTRTLEEIGAGLGSDVAFCALGGTALGTGRGERLARLADLPPHHVVLARPGFGVSTAAAYGWLAAERAQPSPPPAAGAWPAAPGEWRTRWGALVNDFEPVVARRYPETAVAIDTLTRAGAALALLSGSGSAVFGLFEAWPAARAAEAALAERPGWRTWLSRTVDRENTPARPPRPRSRRSRTRPGSPDDHPPSRLPTAAARSGSARRAPGENPAGPLPLPRKFG